MPVLARFVVLLTIGTGWSSLVATPIDDPKCTRSSNPSACIQLENLNGTTVLTDSVPSCQASEDTQTSRQAARPRPQEYEFSVDGRKSLYVQAHDSQEITLFDETSEIPVVTTGLDGLRMVIDKGMYTLLVGVPLCVPPDSTAQEWGLARVSVLVTSADSDLGEGAQTPEMSEPLTPQEVATVALIGLGSGIIMAFGLLAGTILVYLIQNHW